MARDPRIFQAAYQLGMTATPWRSDNRDTYLYFGNLNTPCPKASTTERVRQSRPLCTDSTSIDPAGNGRSNSDSGFEGRRGNKAAVAFVEAPAVGRGVSWRAKSTRSRHGKFDLPNVNECPGPWATISHHRPTPIPMSFAVV